MDAVAAAVQTGQWFNAAALGDASEELSHTFCKHKHWDRETQEEGSTRIDFILVNRLAALAFDGFQLLRDLAVPGHLGLRIRLNLAKAFSPQRRWTAPKLYPMDQAPPMEWDERGALAAEAARPFRQRFGEAIRGRPPARSGAKSQA